MNIYVLQVSAHKKEIKTRDVSIGEKEKRIYELKKKNQVGKNTPFTPTSRHYTDHRILLIWCLGRNWINLSLY